MTLWCPAVLFLLMLMLVWVFDVFCDVVSLSLEILLLVLIQLLGLALDLDLLFVAFLFLLLMKSMTPISFSCAPQELNQLVSLPQDFLFFSIQDLMKNERISIAKSFLLVSLA